jgi:hypothetical protein
VCILYNASSTRHPRLRPRISLLALISIPIYTPILKSPLSSDCAYCPQSWLPRAPPLDPALPGAIPCGGPLPCGGLLPAGRSDLGLRAPCATVSCRPRLARLRARRCSTIASCPTHLATAVARRSRAAHRTSRPTVEVAGWLARRSGSTALCAPAHPAARRPAPALQHRSVG